MAHLIKLNQLDLNHDSSRTYIPILFNLDRAVSMEPSPSGKHTVINTSHQNGGSIRVRETIDEILKLSNGCCDKNQLNG